MKIIVVGSGSIGLRHAANARVMGEVVLVDTNSTLASRSAAELGVGYEPDFDTALARQPDRVIIAVPNRFHIPLARKAVHAGADVLIEKPISHEIEGVVLFLQEAEKLNRKVYVGCNMRFHPAIAKLRENLERIGKLLFARAHVGNFLPNMRPGTDYRKLYCASRKEGGGVILDAIHEIDYLTCFFDTVVDVTATAAKLSDLEIDVEDYACLVLRHASGVVSEIHLDYLRPYKRRGCEIVGDRGMLIWQSEGKKPELCTVRLYQKDNERWETLLATDSLDANQPYKTMLHRFVMGEAGEEEALLLNGRDALSELDVALQALKAAGLNPV